MKSSISFVCQECGYESSQWLGKCPECGMWNSLRELKSPVKNHQSKITKLKGLKSQEDLKPKTLAEITNKTNQRISTSFSEFDNVLGGGIVPGSVTLLAGDPGVGKSTLLLQFALNLASASFQKTQNTQHIRGSDNQRVRQPNLPSFQSVLKVLYISGEESLEQVKLRAGRISKNLNDNKNVLILSSTNTDQVGETIEEQKPNLVIIDSIQTMESENVSGLSGSIPQVRYAASQFIKIAKTLNIPIIIIGHVTKEGMVAGPMILSHMVDSVLFLEGEKFTRIRILRSFKNRFGSLDEVGIFSMEEEGIKEVADSKHLFASISGKTETSGNILVVTLEGTRPFLVEIQGLVVSSHLPVPRRVTSGVDYKRLELLLAVLQKHCGLPLGTMDIFVNVAGGLKISDPAADLGICLAVFSSFKNIRLSRTMAISEVGLLGELRPVQFIEKRVKEAEKMGVKSIITWQEFKSICEVIKSLKR